MILIVGGAGYIGAHVNKLLNESGYETVILDNLSHGHKEAVQWGTLCQCDIKDIDSIEKIFEEYDITAVMHFSSFIEVQSFFFFLRPGTCQLDIDTIFPTKHI